MKWKKKSKMFRITLYKKIETCCVSCKKNTMNENSGVRKTKQNRLTLLSICVVYCKKKWMFMKN